MARQFIYDSVGFSEATLQAGSYSESSGTYSFTANSGLISNIDRLSDQNISVILGIGWVRYEVVQIDLGSEQSPDTIATYHVGTAENNVLNIYASNSNNSWVTGDFVVATGSTLPADEWSVFSLPQNITNKRYIYIYNATNDNYMNVSEILIGSKYTFDVNPELNSKIGEEFGTDVVTSYGGNEYANKRHEPKTTWDFTFSHILSTQKTALEALNANIQDWKKFIYYDDTNYHYVRLASPIEFTEVAPNVFSANVSLREQLA